MGRKKAIDDERLLAVAREVFIDKGIGAPTREIARRAGISEGVIFQRYATKKDLFFAAMVPPPVDADSVFGSGLSKMSALEGLEEVALRILAYYRDVMPMAMRLVTHPSFVSKRIFQRESGTPEFHLLAGLTAYLDGERSRGRLDTDDTEAAAGILVAALHSLALFEIMGAHGGHMEDDRVRALVRSLWNGLAPRHGPPASSDRVSAGRREG